MRNQRKQTVQPPEYQQQESDTSTGQNSTQLAVTCRNILHTTDNLHKEGQSKKGAKVLQHSFAASATTSEANSDRCLAQVTNTTQMHFEKAQLSPVLVRPHAI